MPRTNAIQHDFAFAEEAQWLAMIETHGITQETLGRIVGLSQSRISRRLRRARIARGIVAILETLEPPQADPDEPPRLELCDGPNPRQCAHDRRELTVKGVSYCLECDAISLDGGQTWFDAQSRHTPNFAVRVPDHNGRRYRIHRLTAGIETEPGGPTKYEPGSNGLAGGTGRVAKS